MNSAALKSIALSEGASPTLMDSTSGVEDPDLAQILRNLLVGACLPANSPHGDLEGALLAAVAEGRPQGPVEAMLLAQMTVCHLHATRAMAKAVNSRHPEEIAVWTRLGERLMGLYTRQAEVLAKIRRGGSQKMTVEHVHVHSGGQAVIGEIQTGGAGRWGNE